MLTQARTHAPPSPSPPQKKEQKRSASWDRKRFKGTQIAKKKSVMLGLTISVLFQQFGRPQVSIFFSRGSTPPYPPNPSRVSNRPEVDENIPILPENPNCDSISVGTQEQLSQANNKQKNMFLKNYHRICPSYLGYLGEFRVGVMMEITVHFLVLRKKTSIVFCKH